MEYRLIDMAADGAAVEEAAALWSGTFGDGVEDARRYLARFVGEGGLFCALDETGGMAAILNAVPCETMGLPGVYLYALATRPESRGAGVMSGLMAHAEAAVAQKGAAFSVLVPAGEGLFHYYARRGYQTTSYLREILLEADELRALAAGAAAPHVAALPLTGKNLAAQRGKFAPLPRIEFDPPRTDFMMEELRGEGSNMLACADGYLIYRLPRQDESGVLQAAELFAASDGAAASLLAKAAAQTGAATIKLTLAGESPLFAGQGAQRAFALLKPLGGGPWQHPAPYLRFAMG